MNRSCFAASALALFVAAIPTAVQAQAINQGPVGASVRAGIFFPIDSGARQNATAWPALGGEVRLLKLGSGAPSTTSDWISLSIDWYGRSGWSQAPVLLNFVAKSGQVFIDGGAGIGFSNEPAGSGTDFAYQGGIGYNFPSNGPDVFFVEAKYWGSDRTALDGFAAYIGVHF